MKKDEVQKCNTAILQVFIKVNKLISILLENLKGGNWNYCINNNIITNWRFFKTRPCRRHFLSQDAIIRGADVSHQDTSQTSSTDPQTPTLSRVQLLSLVLLCIQYCTRTDVTISSHSGCGCRTQTLPAVAGDGDIVGTPKCLQNRFQREQDRNWIKEVTNKPIFIFYC